MITVDRPLNYDDFQNYCLYSVLCSFFTLSRNVLLSIHFTYIFPWWSFNLHGCTFVESIQSPESKWNANITDVQQLDNVNHTCCSDNFDNLYMKDNMSNYTTLWNRPLIPCSFNSIKWGQQGLFTKYLTVNVLLFTCANGVRRWLECLLSISQNSFGDIGNIKYDQLRDFQRSL